MYNFLLDSLPDEYEGYLIRTDYRVGIQISQALEDEELTPQERLAVAFSLLYGEGAPPVQTAYRGLTWFLNAGNPPEEEGEPGGAGQEETGIRFFSFDYDATRLYSGFRRMYHIDLDKTPMHWFRFLALLGDLGGMRLYPGGALPHRRSFQNGQGDPPHLSEDAPQIRPAPAGK